jgi:solute:Na+ symporter, SSS family
VGLSSTDYIILAGFFVVMLAIGILYAGRMHDLGDFFSGSHQVPWWLAGISLYMTTFSAFTFVSYSAIAYKHGFVAVTVWWFSIPGCLLSARFLATRWRKAATTSPLEYLETRYGRFLRQGFSWYGVPLIVLDDALKLFVIGTMLTVSLGFETGSPAMFWAIGISGTIIMGYTLLGGLWAVMVTDFIQFIIMAVAVLVLAPLATAKAGGIAAILDKVPDSFMQPTSESYTWPWLLSFSVILALVYATKWPYVQRYYAARSEKDARRVGYLVAALTFIGPPLLFWPAVAARVFIPEIADANEVYPMLCRILLPAGLMGIVIAAMFSATMSMLSSDYNSLSSVITNDIIKRLFLKEASDKTLVRIARISTLFVGTVALLLALLLAQSDDLNDLVKIMAKLFAVLLPPAALPMLAGLLTRRTSEAGAILGFFLGAFCSVGAYFLSINEAMVDTVLPYTTIMVSDLGGVQYLTWISIIPTALGLAVGTILKPDSAEKREKVDAFLDGLTETMAPPKTNASKEVVFAIRMVGSTCLALGLLLAVAVLATAPLSEAWLSFVVGISLAILGGVALAIARKRAAEVGV